MPSVEWIKIKHHEQLFILLYTFHTVGCHNFQKHMIINGRYIYIAVKWQIKCIGASYHGLTSFVAGESYQNDPK